MGQDTSCRSIAIPAIHGFGPARILGLTGHLCPFSGVSLGPKVRSTILLRGIEERSAGETAQILGTSISPVKGRVFQGRRKLRRTVNARLQWGVCAAGPGEARRC
jgi:hypothetical protein